MCNQLDNKETDTLLRISINKIKLTRSLNKNIFLHNIIPEQICFLNLSSPNEKYS